MFHFTGYRVLFLNFHCWLRKKTMANYHHQVTPFGNLRIKVYLPLPEAYRSLSRPSSPVSTKASTVCPKKLDSMFEISHADLPSGEGGFHALRVFRPTYYRCCHRVFAVKIDVFGNQNIFKDRKNSSQGLTPARGLLRFAISCSQSNHISLHMDVKERTRFSVCGTNRAFAENGGPDRTRTYDPRLIKAVL